MKSANESLSLIYFVFVFGSLENSNAKETPKNAPNSVNDALSIATNKTPAMNMIPPTMVVFMFDVIR